MKPIKPLTSACRYCRHYQPEGRRGGMCQQLGSPVQASWKACSLALPPFAPSWESLEDAWGLPDATRVLGSSPTLATYPENTISTPVEEMATHISPEAKTQIVQR